MNNEKDKEEKAQSKETTSPPTKESNENTETEEVDDVSFEEVNDEGEVDERNTIKKLREKIKKLEGEKQEYLNLSQRDRADYVNFKKEVEGNRSIDRKYAKKDIIEELLPVLDSYDMAKGNTESWEKVDSNWRIGVEYIFGQFSKVLEDNGVTSFGKIGDVFDPTLHESIEMVKVTNEKENGKLVRILQNGYRMHDIVLRPARVNVGKLVEEKEDINKQV